MHKIVIVIISIFLVSCGSTKILIPTEADVNRGVNMYPELTMEELHKGKALFNTKCTGCHGVKSPQKHKPDDWAHIVEDMAEKAEKKGGNVTIGEEDQIAIQKYLSVMAEAQK